MGTVPTEAGLADGHGDEIDLPEACVGGVEVADSDIAIRGAEEVAYVGVAVDEVGSLTGQADDRSDGAGEDRARIDGSLPITPVRVPNQGADGIIKELRHPGRR